MAVPRTIRVSPEVIFQEVLLGESLLLHTGTLAYFALDDFGTRLWREIERCDDGAEVLRRLEAGSGLPADVIEQKFKIIINGLQHSGIIELEE